MKSVSFLGALFLVFLTLRLTSVIDWSWWWIALPLYGPVAVSLIVLMLFILAGCGVAVIAGIASGYHQHWRKSDQGMLVIDVPCFLPLLVWSLS